MHSLSIGPLWVVLLPASAFTAVHALAAPTWQGSASDAKWSSSANWTEPITVGGSISTELEFGGTTNLSPHVDNPWTVKSLLFRPQAGSFEIIGKALTFADAALVQNNSPENQFIKNAKVVPSGASTWATSYGNIEVTGVISGAGSLTKTGTAPWASGAALPVSPPSLAARWPSVLMERFPPVNR